MSGTIAHKRRLEAAKQAELAKLRAKAEKQKSLRLNREEVIAEVCAMFGWKELDPFAKEMLDKAFAGQTVDVEQLKKDLTAWKEAQTVKPETEGAADDLTV
jgi:hypothetical protein